MLPVYMLLGPEEGRKKEFIKKLKAEIGDCDISRFYAFEEFEDEFYAQLLNTDLFAPARLVILDNADELKTKDKTKPLAGYIQNPSERVTLVIMSRELYISQDLMKAMPDPQQSIIKFYELFENQKEQWVRDYFRNNGFSIDAQAVNTILERVENNINEFENTCSQICIYMGTLGERKSVGYEDIENFLTHTRQETEFSLFSQIAYGRLDGALECLQTLINTSDSGQISAVLASRLATFFRKLYNIHDKVSEGVFIDDAIKSCGIVMPRDKTVYKAAASRYSMTDTARIIAMLAEYDIAVKEYGLAMQQTVLERCVVRIIKYKASTKSKLEFATL